MNNQKKTCSFQGHEKIPSNIYCISCNVYMCQKCESFHSKLLPGHKIYNIDKTNLDDINQEICNQEKHNLEFQYFCKNHNILCCAKCITKIKNKENGLHKDCDIYTIEEIKEEKINKLNKNINNLELLSKNLEDSVKKLKNIYEKLNKNKEDVKIHIQKIFTKIRNELNIREDSLLKDVDEIYEKNFFGEEIIKQGEKLPNKIKKSLEKCKVIENYNEGNKIISLINECLTIENNIDEINKINDSINKYNNYTNINIVFYPKEEDDIQISKIINDIKIFGNIYKSNDLFEGSSIIANDINKHYILINWIKEEVNKKSINSRLIFKMSTHGYNCEDFHKYCDNKNPTLVLIQTTTNRIFGGFTPLKWNGDEKPLDPNNQTFIFSLDLNKKYKMVNTNKQAIKASKEFGPDFGNDDIQLKKNMKQGVCYADSSCNFIVTAGTELTGGKGNQEDFVTKELEVYQINYLD